MLLHKIKVVLICISHVLLVFVSCNVQGKWTQRLWGSHTFAKRDRFLSPELSYLRVLVNTSVLHTLFITHFRVKLS